MSAFGNMNKNTIWKKDILIPAIKNTFIRLNPWYMLRNPVILTAELCAIVATVTTLIHAYNQQLNMFNCQVSIWLWFTIIFANFAEALAEGKGKSQAESLKHARSEVFAHRINDDGSVVVVPALSLKRNDIVLISDNQIVPSDGEIIEGIALIDESAITGESAPVVREANTDRNGVTGGTKILSGTIKVEINAEVGESFLDQMINMIESTKRKKTPNEIILEVLLLGLTALFVTIIVTMPIFANYMNINIPLPILLAVLVCIIPTTVSGLLPAISIAGMDRLMHKNVVALNGRAIEASGDVNVVLLDKTGTITLGNRSATDFIPAPGITEKELARFAMLASLADETPEGRSIVVLAKEKLQIRGRDIRSPNGATFLEFTSQSRMSGIDINEVQIRKGAFEAIEKFALINNVHVPQEVKNTVKHISSNGGTPLVVADKEVVYGTIYLKDVLKQDIKDRLLQLKNMGISSVMITGDNPITAASIAAEAGVSDFIANATPETKLQRIKQYQQDGYMVAMIGDGTNDAPALAQADVAVAMNAGTQAARDAANMVDLDSSPTKLIDIVEIGKQILITRGALTTFSITNDIGKYFAIIPALFFQYPELQILNIMHLETPTSAILATIIFNALIIPLLIPLALKGVKYSQISVKALLGRNLLFYGLGGIILPFIVIKGLDVLINLHM